MSAPTPAHERRRATLEAVALLLGYVTPATLPGLLPDVLLSRGSKLFLGEAKATETPGSAAAHERLSRYVRHLHRRQRGELLVLCVGDHPTEWAAVLVRLSSHISSVGWRTDLRALSPDEWLVTTQAEKRQGPEARAG